MSNLIVLQILNTLIENKLAQVGALSSCDTRPNLLFLRSATKISGSQVRPLIGRVGAIYHVEHANLQQQQQQQQRF